MLEQITPLIITCNEAPNIRCTLDKLLWSQRIIVIDSGSVDETLDILQRYHQVEVFHHPFQDFAAQCNFGLTRITTAWVLSLDADYELSDELAAELNTLEPTAEIAGYEAPFVYRIYGRSLRGSLYPPRTVLYRRDNASYHNEGHGHRVRVKGKIVRLNNAIYHDDRKSFTNWIATQQRYACNEADYLLQTPLDKLSRFDKIRRMGWPAPILAFVYTLIRKKCIFDGWVGWYYALQRLCAETLIALEILDRRLRGNS